MTQCTRCPEEAVTEILDATGPHPACAHCAEVIWNLAVEHEEEV